MLSPLQVVTNADLTSREYSPPLLEESGEAGPLAKARASGRSQNPIPVEDVNRHGAALRATSTGRMVLDILYSEAPTD